MKYRLLSSSLLLLFPLLVYTQDYDVGFKAGEVPSNAMSLPSSENDSIFDPFLYHGDYYLIMQFFTIPAGDTLQHLENEGIELFSYIPNFAYLAKIPDEAGFMHPGVRGLAGYEGSFKLSAELASGDYPDYAYQNGMLDLVLTPWPSVPAVTLANDLMDEGYSPTVDGDGRLLLTIHEDELADLSSHPGIQYVAFPEPLPEKDGYIGRSSHRVNMLNQGPGLGYDGSGVGIAIGDDGTVDHVDFAGRLTDLTNGTNFGTHGDMTAGLAIGAGNLNPDYMGFAPGSDLRLYFISGYPHITQAPDNYQNYGTIITSTSFGEGCGGRYTSTTQYIDKQVYNNPKLLHFFSAGNSAFSSCSSIYGQFNFGNITGGRKAGKNVFAVANLFYDDTRVASSSRGPAEDGRIKPDISGHGQGSLTTGPDNGTMTGGGTSAASPSVAGTAAALVHGFRDKNQQQDPSAALIKGIMLNTADDLGRLGPDYDFGWGRVNARRAMEVIDQGWYQSGSVGQGGRQSHTISVPANTKELRVMVYWTDAEGSPVAGKALVNDLDLRVETPGGATYHPWVLSTAAHADSLIKPAYRGQDHINNMEQVSLQNPAAGNYQLTIDGYLVPSLSQEYVIVYTFLTDDIEVVFPRGGDAIEPGETTVVRWDAYGNNGSFILEYSTNSGGQWITIANNIPGSQRFYNWNVPNNIASADMRLRVRRGNRTSTVNGDFAALETPQVNVSTVPGNKIRLEWGNVPAANVYKIYKLGSKYMEEAATTSNTYIELDAPSGEEDWYAVQAGISGKGFGKRSVAKPHIFYACETTVEIVLNFDMYPAETSWEIIDDGGFVVASGGNYGNQAPLSSLSITKCLPYGCYDFKIYDSHNDGMCCDDGAGSYQLFDENGDLLISGAAFSNQEVKPFCVENTVTSDLTLSISTQKDASCFGYSDGSVTVSASGGTGHYSYTWNSGATDPSRSNLSAGTYTVTATDGNDQASLSVIIVQPDPLTVSLTSVPPSCTGNADGSISVNVSEGTESLYSYSWNNGSTSSTITGLSAGIYAVTVTNNSGCFAQQATTLISPSPVSAQLTATDESCPGAGNGSVTAGTLSGGSGSYTVSWSTGEAGTTITGLAPGLYEATITDSNGCSATREATVGSGAAPVLDFIDLSDSCPGGNSGSATAMLFNAQGAVSYAWSNGSTGASVSGLAPGTYEVTATDAAGCSDVNMVSIKVSDPIELMADVNPANCADNSFASASVSPSGGTPPYTYLWNMGATSASVFGLPAGSYSVTVTDANGCTGSTNITVEEISPLELSLNATDPSCSGTSDGMLSVSAEAGTPPYSYAWSNGSTGSSANNLLPGTYTVTVTDANGCSATASADLSAPDPIELLTEATDATCQDAQNGEASVTVIGGVSPYTFAWSNGGQGAAITGLNPGEYTVTVTDANGCTATALAEIKELSPIELTLTASDISCHDSADGALSVTIAGGTGNYSSIVWSNGAQGANINGLSAGGYSVTVTDELGCVASGSRALQAPAELTASATVNAATNGSNGGAVISASGGRPPYTFSWSNGASGSNLSGLSPGSYTVSVTDDSGCETLLELQIEEEGEEPCLSRGSSTRYEWIQRVEIGSFVNDSGNDDGLGDFKGDSAKLIKLIIGQPHEVKLTPGFAGAAFNEHWQVWIDLNGDGDFSGLKETMLSGVSSAQAVTAVLNLPDSLTEGTYNMRIAMKYGSPPQPCADIAYGEVEEYRVEFIDMPEYCSSEAISSNSEWIESVSINGTLFESGNNGGYTSYLDPPIELLLGDTVSFELTPGFGGASVPETWQVFVDFNVDGVFDVASERVYIRNGYPFANGGTFVLPADAGTGLCRLRVIMNYGAAADPCGSYIWGETEDYMLRLSAPGQDLGMALENRSEPAEASSPRAVSPPRLFPNPSRLQTTLEFELPEEGQVVYRLFSSSGAMIQQRQVFLPAGAQRWTINTSELAAGMYWLQLQHKDLQSRIPLQVIR